VLINKIKMLINRTTIMDGDGGIITGQTRFNTLIISARKGGKDE
jgi:hypothetical protein